jgi:hypothetical protein
MYWRAMTTLAPMTMDDCDLEFGAAFGSEIIQPDAAKSPQIESEEKGTFVIHLPPSQLFAFDNDFYNSRKKLTRRQIVNLPIYEYRSLACEPTCNIFASLLIA